MESRLRSQIVCNRLSRSKTIRCFARKQMDRWITQHLTTVGPAEAHYLVVLQREGEGHHVNCQIEIKQGRHRWSGNWYGSGLHQAVLECLAHLNLTPQPAYA